MRDFRNALIPEDDFRLNLAGVLADLVTRFLFGVLILILVPRRVHQMAIQIRTGRRVWLRSFAVGLFLAVGLAALGLLSTIAIHTMPVLLVLLIGFMFASVGGMAAIAFAVGRTLLNRAGWLERSPILAVAFGILILFSATRIPFLGSFVFVVVWSMGMGISVLTRFGSEQAWSLQSLMEETET
jgi:hypothetical protein